MKYQIIAALFFLLLTLNEIANAQQPTFYRDNGSKYIYFSSQFTNNDFRDATQLRLGTYLTLGNFGFHNHSWIGNNAILDYTSYGNVGTDGNKNKFKPVYNQGKALVMRFDWGNARLTGYTHSWNNSSTAVDLADFETSWFLGTDKSYFYNSVGIGTTSPSAKLDISTSGDGTEILRFSSERAWAFIQKGTGSATALELKDLTGGKQFRVRGYSNELAFWVKSNTGDGFFAGNLGIGTTTPDHKLDVNGRIRAKEIKVETDWPDFVFEPGYTLKSLEEVETYISKNKHLPDIPSEAEVKAKGINLGEMNAKLLQKIEELTLYVIEQNKKIESQQNQINEMKKEFKYQN